MEARRAGKAQLRARLAAQRLRRVIGLGQVVLGQFAHALFAVNRQKDRRHQRHQRLIGADVRGRLLAADVLLPRSQRQNKSAIPCPIDRLPGQPSRHLAHILLLGRDHAAERTAIAERHAERLRLHGDNVGLDRRPHHAERNRLGNRNDQQRALRVRDLRNGRNVFNDAEKVRALDQHAGRLIGDCRLQRFEIDASGLGVVANQRQSAGPDASHRWPAPRGIQDEPWKPPRPCGAP